MPEKKEKKEKKEKNEKKEKSSTATDQLHQWRERCEEEVGPWKKMLEECNNRVRSRKNTEETCGQEMMDYVKKLDKCAMSKAFAELK